MKVKEFRELKCGDEIKGPNGINYIVHSNCGKVAAVRQIVIPSQEATFWSLVKQRKEKK